MTVVRWLAAVGRFFYSFVVGDDWIVAAVILLALGITALLIANGIDAWWLVPPLAVVMTGVALWRRSASDQHKETQRMGLK
jgi:hypothetical protein